MSAAEQAPGLPTPRRKLTLPEGLYRRLEERLRGSEFRSIDEFVEFVLARLVEGTSAPGEPFSAEDEQRIAQRLRTLGYLD